VSLDRARPRKSGTQLELPFGEADGIRPPAASGEARSAARGDERPGTSRLMEEVVETSNMKAALLGVRENKGSAGVDGMSVEELPEYLKREWPRIREELLTGRYRPQPVRRHAIPKPDGGERELGIPTVLDRLIQQAVLQVLQPRFDPGFSDHSYGFRPGRRAHDAVARAQRYVQEGRRWVVDVDLSKFFDRVNHDLLMGRLAKRIADRRLLALIRRWLEAGVMVSGVVTERREGTPQGGPISPLLANVLLDEVDKELERRGHAFVRYADDSNVYVHTERAGRRVLEGLRKIYEGLRLQINESKSAVDLAVRRDFLGFGFWVAPKGSVRRRIAKKALASMNERVRRITNRNRGRSIPSVVEELRSYLLGWKGYFRFTEAPGVLEDVDKWIRHRMRCLQLKQWKRGRTAYRELRALGVPRAVAGTVAHFTRSWWRNSAAVLNSALPNRHWDQLGVPRLAP